jgi:hypothetical protein
MPEDKADLVEWNAVPEHLGRCGVPQSVCSLDGRHDGGPLHEALHHRRDAVALSRVGPGNLTPSRSQIRT